MFGLPGDFFLPFFRALEEELGIEPVILTHEPAVGDALFASVELETDMFLGLGCYSSMGFAVPAAVGAGLVESGRRPVALVGDGAFLMVGWTGPII